MATPPRGAILYEGPSLLDGAPIVAIATLRSTNRKTGDVPQTWILRRNVDPVTATHDGRDASICGTCPLRGQVSDGRNAGRACYVRVHHGPQSIWAAYRRGAYSRPSPGQIAWTFAAAFVRLGAYGDPAAVPRRVWDHVVRRARGWAGYTHAWRDFDLADLCMASCETDADADDAIARGYRVFRIVSPGAARLADHTPCPAAAEQGHRMTCVECRRCDGTAGPWRTHVQIEAHGHRRRSILPVLQAG